MEKNYRMLTILFNVHQQCSEEKFTIQDAEKECTKLTFEANRFGCGRIVKYNIVKSDDEDKDVKFIDKLKKLIKR